MMSLNSSKNTLVFQRHLTLMILTKTILMKKPVKKSILFEASMTKLEIAV